MVNAFHQLFGRCAVWCVTLLAPVVIGVPLGVLASWLQFPLVFQAALALFLLGILFGLSRAPTFYRFCEDHPGTEVYRYVLQLSIALLCINAVSFLGVLGLIAYARPSDVGGWLVSSLLAMVSIQLAGYWVLQHHYSH